MTTSRNLKKTSQSGFVRLAALTLMAGLTLSACGSGGEAHRRDADGNVMPTARDLDPASTRYSDMMDAAKTGDCSDQTIALLTCYAYRGHGYEGAQTALGQCYIKGKDTKEGITWLSRAANSGWPEAQTALANHYLDGSDDRAEGGKWAILYRRNPSLLSLGVTPDKKLGDKADKVLDDTEKSDAQDRASTWVAKFWKPETALDNQTAATCYVPPRRQFQNRDIDLGPSSADN
ncbi:MAG: hypothetical protein ACOH12_13855 [Parvibaculaceae bacterium]